MASAVRQRIPFRFSEDGEEDVHILDEQEQEESIDSIRKQNEDSNTAYLVGLQVVIGLSLLIHVLYMFSDTKVSPLAVLFPDSSSEPLPLATALTFIQILVHVNLSLYTIPPRHSYRPLFRGSALPRLLSLPLPLSHPIAIVVPALAPIYAVLLGRGRADVLWWAMAGALTIFVALSMKWMRDGEKDIEELDKLRYTAAGA